MIKCGFSEVNITPRLGLNMPGYYENRPAQGVTIPLYARSAVFSDGEKTVGVCALDLLHATREMCLITRKMVLEKAGINADGIMICGLHIHTGAPVEEENDRYSRAERADILKFCELTAESIISAYNNMEECRIAFGKTEETGLAFNRRFFLKNGKCETWPGIANPELDREAGPVDPEVDVLKVENTSGKLLGVISGFACHPDSTGGENYCADYPGALSECMKKRYGDGIVSLFLNGPSGDITHVDYRNIHPIRENHFRYMGEKLFEDVSSVVDGLECKVPENIGYAVTTLKLKRHYPDDEETERALNVIRAYERGEKLSSRSDDGFEKPTAGDDDMMELAFARDIVKLREIGNGTEDTDLRVIRVGDAYFCGFPGENFAQLALDFRKRSIHKNNFLVQLADGCAGYIAPDHVYDEGGYEVRYSTYVFSDRGNGEIINDKLIEIEKDADK